MKFLFKNFLDDKRVYSLNESFYAKLFNKITRHQPISGFNTQFRNGEKFYDGNPIFSSSIDNRILRIIQEAPESENPCITAWIDTATQANLDELVISLELSNETKPVLENLIEKWMVEKVDKNKMEKYISAHLKN